MVTELDFCLTVSEVGYYSRAIPSNWLQIFDVPLLFRAVEIYKIIVEKKFNLNLFHTEFLVNQFFLVLSLINYYKEFILS